TPSYRLRTADLLRVRYLRRYALRPKYRLARPLSGRRRSPAEGFLLARSARTAATMHAHPPALRRRARNLGPFQSPAENTRSPSSGSRCCACSRSSALSSRAGVPPGFPSGVKLGHVAPFLLV